MRLSKLHVALVVALVGCCAARPEVEPKDERRSVEKDEEIIEKIEESLEEEEQPREDEQAREEEESREEEQAKLEDELPILPPIILLDFGNSTSEGNATDEKTKRTVNGDLGYGFQRNALLSGKYNYYFPAGKTGTTVSIEESISPFLPRTIIESAPLSNHKPEATDARQGQSYGAVSGAQGAFQDGTRYQLQNGQSHFGLRTKLHKTSNDNLDIYGMLGTSTPANTFRYSTQSANFVTPSPLYAASSQSPLSFAAPLSSFAYGSSTASPLGVGESSYDAASASYGPSPGRGSENALNHAYSTPSPLAAGVSSGALNYAYSTPSAIDYAASSSATRAPSYDSSTASPLGQSGSTASPLGYEAPSASPLTYYRAQGSFGYAATPGRAGPAGPVGYGGSGGSSGSSIRYVNHRPAYQPVGPNYNAYSAQRQPLDAQNYFHAQSAAQSGSSRPLEQSFAGAGHLAGAYSNLPRYTTENGVRYENKVFWKYPDGRVSDVPPPTYVETSYASLYGKSAKSQASRASQGQAASAGFEPDSSESGLLSQGPIQFPVSQESGDERQSPFISSESISSSIPQQHVYRLGYQSLVSQKHAVNLAQKAKTGSGVSSSFSYSSVSSPSSMRNSGSSGSSGSGSSHRNGYLPSSSSSSSSSSGSSSSAKQRPSSSSFSSFTDHRYTTQRPQSRYMVNSPNPEYVDAYTTQSPVRPAKPASSLFTASAGRVASKRPGQSSKSLGDYSRLEYNDLLGYNPSISQYVSDPSSILNVQPTFVQAGNSLIPVIILKVNGSPPSEPKSSPNVNLKALLQQYLLQYANSVQEFGRSTSYDFGTGSSNENRLADDAQTTRDSPVYSSNDYLDSESQQSDVRPVSGAYGKRTSARQKVKSVQILENPRFATFKGKN